MEIFPGGRPQKQRTLVSLFQGAGEKRGFPRQFLPGVSMNQLPIPSSFQLSPSPCPDFLLK